MHPEQNEVNDMLKVDRASTFSADGLFVNAILLRFRASVATAAHPLISSKTTSTPNTGIQSSFYHMGRLLPRACARVAWDGPMGASPGMTVFAPMV